MSVGLIAARWPSSFFLKKKNQKFKAAQPGAKSSQNSYVQFEAVGMEEEVLKFLQHFAKLLLAVVELKVSASCVENFLNAPFCDAG